MNNTLVDHSSVKMDEDADLNTKTHLNNINHKQENVGLNPALNSEKVDHRRSFSQPQAKHSLLMMLIMMIQTREIAALYAKIWSQWILKYLLQASLFSRLSDNIHLNMEREARQNVNYVAGRSLAFTADLQARILCRQLSKVRLVLLSSCVSISCSFF